MRRRRHGAAIVLAVGALWVGAGACSTFGSDAPSDAGVDGMVSSTDAPNEGASGDGAASEGGVWVPCSARPPDAAHFCDDFDQDLDKRINYRWSSVETSLGFVDASADALSPPRALTSFVPATDDASTN